MLLFDVIDKLFFFARYLVWGIAVVCVPASLVLLAANLPLGLTSALVFLGALLLAAGLALILMPGQLAQKVLPGQNLVAPTAVLCGVAALIVGAVYFLGGGFPALNLLFV